MTCKQHEFDLHLPCQANSERGTEVVSAGMDGDEREETEVDYTTDGNSLQGVSCLTSELLDF